MASFIVEQAEAIVMESQTRTRATVSVDDVRWVAEELIRRL